MKNEAQSKKPQHTPGPWETDGRAVININDATFRAIVESYGAPVGQAAANARLIAQAPAMLALVKKLADAGLPFGDEPHDLDDSDILDARAILATIDGSAPVK